MRRTVSILALSGLLSILPLSRAQAADSPGATAQVLRGEVLMFTTELLVVKNSEGTSTLVPLDKGAKVDQTIKVGDHVEVRVTGAGEAEIVTKSSAQPSRESKPTAN